eukprot:TRINITY_DN1286_c0_g1_i6.p1 TRINITY_DN1286_c0_g1~~TRINITY_DN1286_c0_g1_i6.p1  ORF type:complete len:1347 (-),score=391.81 TRINITY_DN1286_c0_g1_i6:62-4102(-)
MEDFRFKRTYFDKNEIRELIARLGDEGEVISRSHLLSIFLQDYATYKDSIMSPSLGGLPVSRREISDPSLLQDVDLDEDMRLKFKLVIGSLFDAIRVNSDTPVEKALKHPRWYNLRAALKRKERQVLPKLHGETRGNSVAEVVPLADFIDALSVMCRGEREERMKLVFDICDLGSDNRVVREDLLTLATTVHSLLSIHFPAYTENLASPTEAVNSLFASQKVLNLTEFVRTADQDPDVHRCFGLFDYFYYSLVRPVEAALANQDFTRPPRQHGYLFKKKNVPIMRYYTVRWFEIRDGFLIYYKHFSRKKKPRRVISLLHSTVRVIYTKRPHLSLRRFSRDPSAPSPGGSPVSFRSRSRSLPQSSLRRSSMANSLPNDRRASMAAPHLARTPSPSSPLSPFSPASPSSPLSPSRSFASMSSFSLTSESSLASSVSTLSAMSQTSPSPAPSSPSPRFSSSSSSSSSSHPTLASLLPPRSGSPVRIRSPIRSPFRANGMRKHSMGRAKVTWDEDCHSPLLRSPVLAAQPPSITAINPRTNTPEVASPLLVRRARARRVSWAVEAAESSGSEHEDFAESSHHHLHIPHHPHRHALAHDDGRGPGSTVMEMKDGKPIVRRSRLSSMVAARYLSNAVAKKILTMPTRTDFVLRAGTYARRLSARSERQAYEWINAIRANSRGGYRFHSFAPPRVSINSKWYVNAMNYYSDVAAAIPLARHEIFIAGWWFCPELYLKRGPEGLAERYRVDNLLAERARAGVKIYILIWNETNLSGFELGSQFAKVWMEGMSSRNNIKVIRHPKYVPLTWTHHQKLVVIDQAVAFMGGIDLCFGRYEDESYMLCDVDEKHFPGADYGNSCLLPFRMGDPTKSLLDRQRQARMPWHDIGLRVDGLAARDVCFNFIQRWNHAKESNRLDTSYPYLVPSLYTTTYPSLAVPLRTRRDSITANLAGLPMPSDSMESDTESIISTGSPPPVSRILSPAPVPTNMSLFSPRPLSSSASDTYSDTSSVGALPMPHPLDYYATDTCNVQIVRSVAQWSAGQQVEDSIYKAYISLISRAKRFIFIQNQYFISSVDSDQPKNKLALALVRRIRRAILQSEVFRVVIVLPVHSEGDLAAQSTRLLVEWTLRTINAMQAKLRAEFPDIDVEEYLVFNALRTWEKSGDSIFTEQVYVHSKMMIVDDQIVVIGSANINDRSMRGSRDSEIAAIIEGGEQVSSKMEGEYWEASQFALSMRIKLWRGHLGMGKEEDASGYFDERLLDPICDATYNGLWRAAARSNTQIYAAVFGTSIPENCLRINQLTRDKLLPAGGPEEEELHRVRGLLIEYPMGMLAEEQLTPAVFTPEWFVSMSVFL